MTQRTSRFTRSIRKVALLLVMAMSPLLMGGCPEFQNTVADAFETATRGIVDAAVTLYFDQFRSGQGP